MHPERIVEHALKLVDQSVGYVPLHHQLSKYFSAHKSMGSRDRRFCRALVYSFYRITNALPDLPIRDQMSIGAWLMNELPADFVSYLLSDSRFDLNLMTFNSFDERLECLKQKTYFNIESLFPCKDELSNQISKSAYCLSMLSQPLVWIRVRPSYIKMLNDELNQHNIFPLVQDFDANAWAFAPGIKLDQLNSFSLGYFEVQDLASQRVVDFLHPKKGQSWWDACAASGGKSLMLLDKIPDLKLLATDVRANILENFKERMKKAGHNQFRTKHLDLTKEGLQKEEQFDGIIADVPCTGSGTWARTPEQLRNFNCTTIQDKYVPLQRSILENIVPQLSENSQLVYITCSVFKSENEENVNWMVERFKLKVVSASYISCYFDRADTMFAAIITK